MMDLATLLRSLLGQGDTPAGPQDPYGMMDGPNAADRQPMQPSFRAPQNAPAAPMQVMLARGEMPTMPARQPAQPSRMPAQMPPQQPAQQQARPQGRVGNAIGDFVGELFNPGRKARNMTVEWLQQNGLDEGSATLVAGNRDLLNRFMVSRMSGGDPDAGLDTELKRLQIDKARKDLNAPPPENLTDDEREYQRAASQGYKGTFLDWQTKGVRDREDNGFANEQALRKEYSTLPERKRYDDVRASYERVRTSASRQTGAGDLGLIFGYMKMLDPGSVVREGEFANAENSASVPDRIRNLYNRIMDGERLNTAQRREFVAAAGDLYGREAESLKRLNQRYGNIAGQYKIDPARIYEDAMSYEPLEIPDQADAATGLPGAPAVGTVEQGHRFKGGDPSDRANWEPVR